SPTRRRDREFRRGKEVAENRQSEDRPARCFGDGPAASSLGLSVIGTMKSTLLTDVADLCLDAGLNYHDATTLQQEHYIRRALDRSEGNIWRAARLVAMHRNQFAKKLVALGLAELPQKIRLLPVNSQLSLFGRRPSASVAPKKPSSISFRGRAA